jgi:hypothetical protein
LAATLAKQLGLPLTIIGPILDPRYAAQLARAGSRLVGGITRSRTLELMRASAGLLWLPTEREPGGRVIEEALRLGVPVWGRPYGVVADIVTRRESHSVLRHEGEPVIHVCDLPSFLPKSASAVAREYWSIFYEISRSVRAVAGKRARSR